MRGVFGGELEQREGTSVERVAPEIVAALRGGPPREPLPEQWEALGGVEVVTFDVAGDGEVRFSRDLSEAQPLGALVPQRATALAALGRAAAAVGALHAADACHGELGLGADAVRVLDGGKRVMVLMPATRPEAGALLGARLRAGALPAAAAFSAPEVVTGYEAKGASDVYALAAIAHEIVTGRAPLGQIDFDEARQGPFARLAPFVGRALAANPAARPSAGELAAALREASEVAHGLEQAGQAGPYRGAPAAKAAPAPAKSAAEASARKQQASSMSGILMLMLAVGGLFVFMGAVWLVGVTWSALDGPGRSVLLFALTTGVLGAGVALGKKGYEGSGRALVVLGVELFWADGAYLLDVGGLVGSVGAWTALAAAMTAIAFALAAALGSAVFGALAALHFSAFAGLLGAYLHTGKATGPTLYALGTAIAASALAGAGHALRRERMGTPFGIVASLSALASALGGLVLVDNAGHRDFGTAWPYLVFAIAAAVALAPRNRYGMLAAFAAGAILTVTPTTQALVRFEVLPYLLAAIAIGFAVLGAAFTWPRLARDPGTQATWVLVGLASVATGPGILFLVKCWGKDGLETLAGPDAVYLILVVAVPAALVAASYALGRRAQRKATYRLLELTGLVMFFGAFTLLGMVRYKDAFYPLAILAAGGACFVVGATTKRATLVVLASGALLCNLAIQYFAKLWDVFPASLLVLIFGLMLLAGGVGYERRLKHLLPGLREWG